MAVLSAPRLLALGPQVVDDLAGAQQNRLGVGDLAFGHDGGKLSRPSASDVEVAARVAQQALGRHDDQRLAPLPQHLPAQQVEVLRRRRRLDDLDVVLGAQLQEALDARARMLRPLPFVAVRQQHTRPLRALPLVLAGGDELVDDDLRAVGEVAELRLPERRARRGSRGCSRTRSRAPPPRRAGSRRRRNARVARTATASGSRLFAGLAVERARVCRWLKVPRATSPARRGAPACPRAISDPNASDSAMPQSIGFAAAPSRRRFSSETLRSCGCTLKPSGRRSRACPELGQFLRRDRSHSGRSLVHRRPDSRAQSVGRADARLDRGQVSSATPWHASSAAHRLRDRSDRRASSARCARRSSPTAADAPRSWRTAAAG